VGTASTVAVEECKQTKEGMQTHGRKWSLENKNMLHKSLKLKSQQYTEEKDKVWMNEVESTNIEQEKVHIYSNCVDVVA
jgi:hypothetical protein